MVKFLKLPVLFRRVIYLMNKASPSISLPPFLPRSSLTGASMHCLCKCLMTDILICINYSTAFALSKGAALNMVDHCLGCFPYEVPLGGCPNKTQLEKNREPCYPGSPASWTSKVPASPFLCFVFCILGELESIPEEGCFCFQEKQRPGRECKGVGIPPTLAATCMMASAGSDTCSS